VATYNAKLVGMAIPDSGCSNVAGAEFEGTQSSVSVDKTEQLSLRQLFEKHYNAMAMLTGVDKNEVHVAGAGFHIGNGWIATTRHVVENIAKLRMLDVAHNETAIRHVHFHQDPEVDIAVLETAFDPSKLVSRYAPSTFGATDFIPISANTDEYIDDSLLLTRVLLMGYPPIAMSAAPALAAVTAEVNAILKHREAKNVSLILSSTPRGGFSGGPVIGEFGGLLGIFAQELQTQRLQEADALFSAEMPFSAALSVQPLLELLRSKDMMPPGWTEVAWKFVAGPAQTQEQPTENGTAPQGYFYW
jgi:hypothetical protein